MNQNKRGMIILMLLLALALAGATISGTFFGVAELSFLVADSTGILIISAVVAAISLISLWKPEIFSWLLTLTAVVVVLLAIYGAFVSGVAEYQFLGGLTLIGSVLAVIGSALQWHNAKLAESPSYQNVWGMNLVAGMIALFVGASSSAVWGIVTFIVVWLIVIVVLVLARKASRGIQIKLHR